MLLRSRLSSQGTLSAQHLFVLDEEVVALMMHSGSPKARHFPTCLTNRDGTKDLHAHPTTRAGAGTVPATPQPRF
jgi:hypothetical protein